jgi:hypothetical protein
MARYTSYLKLRLLSSTVMAAGILIGAATGVGCQSRTKEKEMNDSFYVTSPENAVKLDQTPITIQAVPANTIARATVARGADGCPRPFVNQQLNSRLAYPLGTGDWKIQWQEDIAAGLYPSYVLEAHDRIVVQGNDRWQLFDADGKSILTAPLGPSSVFIDSANSLFYLSDENGYIAARRLSDGGEEFVFHGYFGNDFRRTLIERNEGRMLIVSIERQIDAHGRHQPNLSVIEVQDLGAPLKINADHILVSAKRQTNLMRDTINLHAAMRGETLVLATDQRIYFTDLALKINSVLQAEFTPLAMSIDEASRVYLLVQTKAGLELWVVTKDGKRVLSSVLPQDMRVNPTPPIVSYNHRIYILGADRVMAIAPSGRLAWVRSLKTARASAVVTADDQLLVSDGSELVVFDESGKRRVLQTFADDVLTTPPVLSSDGEILVASEHRLYCLSH